MYTCFKSCTYSTQVSSDYSCTPNSPVTSPVHHLSLLPPVTSSCTAVLGPVARSGVPSDFSSGRLKTGAEVGAGRLPLLLGAWVVTVVRGRTGKIQTKERCTGKQKVSPSLQIQFYYTVFLDSPERSPNLSYSEGTGSLATANNIPAPNIFLKKWIAATY